MLPSNYKINLYFFIYGYFCLLLKTLCGKSYIVTTCAVTIFN